MNSTHETALDIINRYITDWLMTDPYQYLGYEIKPHTNGRDYAYEIYVFQDRQVEIFSYEHGLNTYPVGIQVRKIEPYERKFKY